MPPSREAQDWGAADGAAHPTVQRCIELLAARHPGDAAPPRRECAEQLFRWAAWRYIEQHEPAELAGLVDAAYAFLRDATGRDIRVRVFNPTERDDAWPSAYTVVLATVSDRPFVYDSVYEYLLAEQAQIAANLHPVLGVDRRDGQIRFLPPLRTHHRESLLVFELARVDDNRCQELKRGITRVLEQVVPATDDYGRMTKQARHLMERLRVNVTAYPERGRELQEAVDLLAWLLDKNFVFLGYREYDLGEADGEPTLCVRPDSGLGILRDTSTSRFARPVPLADLPPEARRELTDGPIMRIRKTSRPGVVHRRTRMEYIGIKQLDPDGRPEGQVCFLGLFTAAALSSPASEIPLLRHKLDALLERSGLPPGTHDYKQITEVFEGLPKSELFQASIDDLQGSIDALIVGPPEAGLRCVLREDFAANAVAVMVIMPRDRFNVLVRRRIQHAIEAYFHGSISDYQLAMGSAASVRLHFAVQLPRDESLDIDRTQLEAQLQAAIESWEDRFRARLRAEFGRADGDRLFARWGDAFPEGYQERTSSAEAVEDVRVLVAVQETGAIRVAVRDPVIRGAETPSRLKVYVPGKPLILSDMLPILENLGLHVIDEVPTEIACGTGTTTFIHDFGVVEAAGRRPLDTAAVADRLGETILRVLDGQAQNDSLNALVVHAAMRWREVALIRTYLRYYRQLGTAFTAVYLSRVLVEHAAITRLLLQLFVAKFTPPTAEHGPGAAARDVARAATEAREAIDAVESLEADRILRAMLNLVESTIRTNYFRDGGARPYISIKVRSADVSQMPLPRPMFEIFVHSPRMEGIHLRGGKVARGGIRWSDRPEDYRTEILGLMKTQMTKNAVIVPVGAKGGFIIRRPSRSRERLAEQVVELYSDFIRGLLDVTDNIVDGTIVRPPDVVALDEEDPYLVVAADKGTAHLSDTANAISLEYGFWLGDAFASGGSTGYDHKKEGITARGAWECAKRHFRELDKNIQREPFTVVGIGDMGGDVFGNGMLCSKAIELVAAFNHMHIFLDPHPDPSRSWDERKRLFELPRSTWRDYDPELISKGGGVFDRRAKRIPLSPEVREVLGTKAAELAGPDLVRAILQAPVEMLYNGGIGTYVKATGETHLDVGDKANDAVRVNGAQVRARVVVEGGNLGITQRGRIELARHGVKLNTDATDNSGGVDMSDHEVNLKILLAQAIVDGDLEMARRNQLLEDMTDTVAAHVLRTNYRQSLLISQDEYYSQKRLMEFRQMLDTLTDVGGLDRDTEFLPADEELQVRGGAGDGLTRPELAVMAGYAKNWLYDVILHSPLVDDPHLHHLVEAYFPAKIVREFPNAIRRHRLRRELLATEIANRVVNQAGTTFVRRLIDQTNEDPPAIVWAYLVSNEMFRFDDLRAEIFALDDQMPAGGQYKALRNLETVLADLTKWVLQNVPALTSTSEVLTRFRSGAESAVGPMLELYAELEGADVETLKREYRDLGLTDAVAEHFVLVPALRPVLDVLLISENTETPEQEVVDVYMRSQHELRLPWLLEATRDLPAASLWERIALDSAREDLQAQHRRIVYAILRGGRAGEPAITAMHRYWRERERQINSYLGLVAQLGGTADITLAVLNVISRYLKMI